MRCTVSRPRVAKCGGSRDATDLENKLREYQCYYNKSRAHSGRDGRTPNQTIGSELVDINKYRCEKYCRGLFELPIAA
jgi:putative transposase